MVSSNLTIKTIPKIIKINHGGPIKVPHLVSIPVSSSLISVARSTMPINNEITPIIKTPKPICQGNLLTPSKF